MAFSYSGLTNYGKATLPSVGNWGQNTNILRDPSRSITTRRIDKVGETSSITSMIDDSANRACEGIRQFALGVDPMVSVSYSNSGNNGGQKSGGITVGGSVQPKLPYGIIKDGAFRPPVRTQIDLLPLSRQPRVWTSSFAQPGFVDFSKKMRVCGTAENTREVKTDTLKTCIRPTAVYQMEVPQVIEAFQLGTAIQSPVKTSGNSGVRTMDRTTTNVAKPTKINRDVMYTYAQSNVRDNRHVNTYYSEDPSKGIHEDNMHAYAQSNLREDRYMDPYDDRDPTKGVNEDNMHVYAQSNLREDKYVELYGDRDTNMGITDDNMHVYAQSNLREDRYVDNNNFNGDRYIQDTNVHSVHSNLGSKQMQITPIEDIIELSDIRVKDIANINYTTPIKGNDKTKYIHDERELSRKMPEYSSSTNIGKNIDKNMRHEYIREYERNTPLTEINRNITVVRGNDEDVNSRKYKLQEKVVPGGFEGKTSLPQQNRVNNVRDSYDTQRSKMSKMVLEQQLGRY